MAEPRFMNLPNQRLDEFSQIDLNRMIEGLIEEFSPHTVFTHFYGDINRDYQVVYESTMVATRPKPCSVVRRVFSYSAPSATEWIPYTTGRIFVPNWFTDVSSVVETKMMALRCYKTETPAPPHPRSLEMLRQQMAVCGARVGFTYAEELMLIRNLEE